MSLSSRCHLIALPPRTVATPFTLAWRRRQWLAPVAASNGPARQLTVQLQRCTTLAELRSLLARCQPQALDPQSLSASFCLLAKLSQPRGTGSTREVLLEQLLEHLQRKLQGCGIRQLANCVWALGRLQCNPRHPSLKALLARLGESHGAILSEANPVELSNLWYGLARLDAQDGELLQALAGTTVAARLVEGKPPELVGISWGVATLRYRDDALLAAVAASAWPQLPSCSPRELSILLWAFASLGVVPPPAFLAGSCRALAEKLLLASPRDIATAAWSCAVLLELLHGEEQQQQKQQSPAVLDGPHPSRRTPKAAAVAPLRPGPVTAGARGGAASGFGELRVREEHGLWLEDEGALASLNPALLAPGEGGIRVQDEGAPVDPAGTLRMAAAALFAAAAGHAPREFAPEARCQLFQAQLLLTESGEGRPLPLAEAAPQGTPQQKQQQQGGPASQASWLQHSATQEDAAAAVAEAAGGGAPQQPRLPAKLLRACEEAWVEQLGQSRQSALQAGIAEAVRRLGGHTELEGSTADGLFRVDLLAEWRGRHYIIEADGPSHFTANLPHRCLGATLARRGLLGRAAALPLVAVPFHEWDALGGRDQLEDEYLRGRLMEAGGPEG